ncbi:phage major capsid protein [Endozoicomonas gorgoniicola]|uniref:Phage major capsid protein n=1 Tax=Endozoicomonas gorgoniicola TaxID=1234144 RepID=A0ABT3MRY2_9GAMM|nr:phage major capsid protein [Endozoicomonas gorgoniicola]MCW7552141.1 phage major capsid protein [Endozoicomonas gorgoniicola]
MSDELKRLQEKRATIADKMAKLVEVAEKEDRGISSDERGQWNTMRTELEAMDQRIADLKEAIEHRRSVEVPLNPLPAETREYELDDFGNPVMLKKPSKDQRADEAQQYTDAFMALLRSGQPGMLDLDQNQRQILRDHYVKEERAQGVVPSSSGGYLIPTTLSNRIIETMQAYGGIRQFATVMNTTAGEVINWPTNDDTGNEGEIVAEHAKVDEGDLVFGQKALGAYKYSSKVIRVSIELLQDNAFALDSFITRKFGQRLGRITARHYATGTGSGQPQGLLPAASVGHTSSSPTDINYKDLLHLKHSIDPAYRNMASCRWLFNDKVLLQLKEMLDDNNRPLWKPSMADGTPALIDGDPFVIDQGCPDPASDVVTMAYGDLSEFVIRDVLGFTLHRMVEKYIDYGQIGFLAFMRTDSNLMDSEAVKTLKMKKAPK